MKLETLLAGLKHPDATTRSQCAQVLGLVEETKAVNLLRDCYACEQDPATKRAFQWAGKRVVVAQKRGYSTLDALFEHFRVNRELEFMDDPAHARFFERLNSDLDSDLRQSTSGMNIAGAAAGLLAGGLPGALTGASAGKMKITDTTEIKIMEEARAHVRLEARPLSDYDYRGLLTEMESAEHIHDRERAATSLVELNNPAVLPHLARAYLHEEVLRMRETIERTAKLIYMGALYWHMTQDGSLEQEIQKRRASVAQQPQQQPEPSKEDVAEILRKAEEARKKRRRGS